MSPLSFQLTLIYLLLCCLEPQYSSTKKYECTLYYDMCVKPASYWLGRTSYEYTREHSVDKITWTTKGNKFQSEKNYTKKILQRDLFI